MTTPHLPAPKRSSADLLAHTPLPHLHGPESTAEHLVLLVHRGVDWNIWGGTRRVKYWDALTDRTRAATYAGPTLSQWWQAISAELGSQPHSKTDRAQLAELLADPQQRAVLQALHQHAPTLVLRVRVLIEHTNTTTQEDPSANDERDSDRPHP